MIFARRAVTVLLTLVATVLLAAPASADQPHPGSAGLGDRVYPLLGNGGYDTTHYSLHLRYPTSAPSQTVNGVVKISARATQSLSRFNLDFAGDSVDRVRVNGYRADFARDGEELVITPRRSLRKGKRFTVRVAYTGHPYVPPGPDVDPCPFGWFTTKDGSVTAGQPNSAHTIYPVNDHPSDKASYSFRIDVPRGVTAVANGVETGRRDRAGRTVWSYDMRQPMASELIQLAVGDLAVKQRGRQDGVQLRDVEPASLTAALEPALSRTPDHLAWMTDRVGRYPFGSYGVLAADQDFCYALETQTLSLHPVSLFQAPATPGFYEPILVHELAHQWFGDSVAPQEWSDVWLNEGHATWYEQEYSEQFFGTSFEDYLRDAYTRGNQLRAEFGPVARPSQTDVFGLFSPNVYEGGALVLYALRQVVGDPTFREIERGWAQRKAGRSVSTEDFIRFASRVSHRDLRGFLREWVYGTEIPPMPGHSDWTADPVEAMPQARAFAAERAGSFLKRY